MDDSKALGKKIMRELETDLQKLNQKYKDKETLYGNIKQIIELNQAKLDLMKEVNKELGIFENEIKIESEFISRMKDELSVKSIKKRNKTRNQALEVLANKDQEVKITEFRKSDDGRRYFFSLRLGSYDLKDVPKNQILTKRPELKARLEEFVKNNKISIEVRSDSSGEDASDMNNSNEVNQNLEVIKSIVENEVQPNPNNLSLADYDCFNKSEVIKISKETQMLLMAFYFKNSTFTTKIQQEWSMKFKSKAIILPSLGNIIVGGITYFRFNLPNVKGSFVLLQKFNPDNLVLVKKLIDSLQNFVLLIVDAFTDFWKHTMGFCIDEDFNLRMFALLDPKYFRKGSLISRGVTDSMIDFLSTLKQDDLIMEGAALSVRKDKVIFPALKKIANSNILDAKKPLMIEEEVKESPYNLRKDIKKCGRRLPRREMAYSDWDKVEYLFKLNNYEVNHTKNLLNALKQQNLKFGDDLDFSQVKSLADKEFEIQEIGDKNYQIYEEMKKYTRKGNYGPLEVVFKDEKVGWYVVAKDDIPKLTLLCEYAGSVKYKKDTEHTGSDSIFHLAEDMDIIPETFGNIGKYISGINAKEMKDNQNAACITVLLGEKPHILTYAFKDIKKDEIIYYDYNEGGLEGYNDEDFYLISNDSQPEVVELPELTPEEKHFQSLNAEQRIELYKLTTDDTHVKHSNLIRAEFPGYMADVNCQPMTGACRIECGDEFEILRIYKKSKNDYVEVKFENGDKKSVALNVFKKIQLQDKEKISNKLKAFYEKTTPKDSNIETFDHKAAYNELLKMVEENNNDK